jgi:tetratricopeptide (TPR) repeat protein
MSKKSLKQKVNKLLAQGETATVREEVLRLYIKAGASYVELDDDQQALETYQEGLSHAQAFLTAGENSSGVREEVLGLYINTGVSYENLGNWQQAIETFQEGISHAQTFLTAGEKSSGVREVVLILYNGYSSDYYNIGQTNQVIPLLPMKGIWSHVALAQVEPNNQQDILYNWQNKLEISPNFPHFTTAFQTFLRTLLLDWHSPKRTHRHFDFIPTKILLAISESLYTLTQVENHQPLHAAYQRLTTLADSDWIEMALQQHSQVQEYQKQLEGLKNTWWDRWQRWWIKRKIKGNQTLAKAVEADDDQEWQLAIKQTDDALMRWLKTAIVKHLKSVTSLQEEKGLNDLPAIALAMLLVSESLTTDDPETIFATWQHNPLWRSAEDLRAAFAPSHWQNWIDYPKRPLSSWIYSLERNDILRRLSIVKVVENKAQPKLQKWLNELSAEPKTLLQLLPITWQAAQTTAKRLAQIFTALADPDCQADLFAAYTPTDIAYQQALSAIILGDVEAQIDNAVNTWLQQQTSTHSHPLLNIFDTQKMRFDKIAALINQPPPRQEVLAQDVHDWAQVYLKETLEILNQPNYTYGNYKKSDTEEQISLSSIWEILERARIGLNSLTLKLPDDWAETLGEELWKDLGNSIRWLTELINHSKSPEPETMWLPLKTWLDTFDKWLSKPPTIQVCQNRLHPDEALIQPFFDPIQQRLRILWLDKNHPLEVRELPDPCAAQENWTLAGIMKKWDEGIKALRMTRGAAAQHQDWEQVMQSEPVHQLANTLQHWATEQQLEQLTIIFPAPLGQLPWEALPQLEMLLVREVSIAHWFKHTPEPISKPKTWVTCDPSGEAQCMIKEAQWVATHFNTPLNAPCESLFNALSGFANHRTVHLSTHGLFNSQNPTNSYLTLNDDKNHHLPLWMITALQTSADLVMLSACESNLTGQETEDILTPIGIGPTLAAAGAKTVAGTLWSCNGVAAFCFSTHFYKIAQADPKMPWHKVAARARKALQEMTHEELKAFKAELKIPDEIQGACEDQIFLRINRSRRTKLPFEAFPMWAGFIVLGKTRRNDKNHNYRDCI